MLNEAQKTELLTRINESKNPCVKKLLHLMLVCENKIPKGTVQAFINNYEYIATKFENLTVPHLGKFIDRDALIFNLVEKMMVYTNPMSKILYEIDCAINYGIPRAMLEHTYKISKGE